MGKFATARKFIYANEKRWDPTLIPDLKEWFDAEVKCGGCGSVGAHRRPKPLDLEVEGCGGCGGEIAFAGCSAIHPGLLEQLSPYNGDVVIGACSTLHESQRSTVYRTIYPTRAIVTRSAVPKRMREWTNYRTCGMCGHNYVVAPERPYHLLTCDVGDRRVMYTSHGWPLIDADLFRTLDLAFKDRLALTEYPVLESPLDGHRFPGDTW